MKKKKVLKKKGRFGALKSLRPNQKFSQRTSFQKNSPIRIIKDTKFNKRQASLSVNKAEEQKKPPLSSIRIAPQSLTSQAVVPQLHSTSNKLAQIYK